MTIEELEKHLHSGEYKQVVDASAEMLKANPQSATVYGYIGVAYRGLGDNKNAEKYFRDAIKCNNRNAKLYYNLGITLQDQGKLDEAIACYQKSIDIDPKFSDAHNNLGSTYFSQERYDKALQSYFSAIKLNPSYDAPHLNMGNIFFIRDNKKAAAKWYKKAVDRNPKNYQALLNLGKVMADLREKQTALEILKKATEERPKDPEALLTFAQTLRKFDRIEEAIEILGKAIKIDPKDGTAYHLLGRIYNAQGDKSSAVRNFTAAIDKGPTGYSALQSLAAMPRSVVSPEIVRNYLDTNAYDKHFSSEVSKIFFKANVADKQRNFAEAWELYKDANDMHWLQLDFDQQQFFAARMSEKRRLNERGVSEFFQDESTNNFIYIIGPSRAGKTSVEHALHSDPKVVRGYESSALSRALTRSYDGSGRKFDPRLHLLPEELKRTFLQLYIEEMGGPLDRRMWYSTTLPFTISSALEFAEIIPNCHFVFVRRAPEEVAIQMYRTHYRSENSYSYHLRFAYSQATWYNKMIDLCAGLLPEQSVVIDYEAFVSDPDLQIERICDQFGMSFEGQLDANDQFGEIEAKDYLPYFKKDLEREVVSK